MFFSISHEVWGKVWGNIRGDERFGGGMGNLTATGLRNLREAGRFSDGGGLILFRNKSGKASWIVRVQANGRRRDVGIGSYPDVSLADARELAASVRKLAKAGVDVVAERKKEREVIPTVREAAAKVHAEHKKGWKNGKHQDQWISTLEAYAYPHFGDALVSDIEAPAIRDALAEIWLEKPETARRVRQRIGTVLDWSFSRGFRSSEAPMRSISKGLPRQPRKSGNFAAMPFAAVPAFLARLRQRSSVGRLALEFLILNASRSGEVRNTVWSEFDLKRRVWIIPAERMKMGEEHQIPLTRQALHVIDAQRSSRPKPATSFFPASDPRVHCPT